MNLEEIAKWECNGRVEKTRDQTLKSTNIWRSSRTWRNESQSQIPVECLYEFVCGRGWEMVVEVIQFKMSVSKNKKQEADSGASKN